MPSLEERARLRRERAAEQSDDSDGGGGGPFQGLPRMLTALPVGVAKFAGQTAKTAGGVAQLPLTALTSAVVASPLVEDGDKFLSTVDSLPGLGQLVDEGLIRDSAVSAQRGEDFDTAWRNNYAEQVPVFNDMAGSGWNTGNRLVDTAQWAASPVTGNENAENPYLEAWRNDSFAPLLVEDLGNAALVGGAVARGVGAGARSATGGATRAQARAGLDDAVAAGDDVAAAAHRQTLTDAAPRGLGDRLVGDALAPHAERLSSASMRMGSGAVTADRIAAPWLWPKFAANPVVRRVAPQFADEAAQSGSYVLTGLRNTKHGQDWLNRVSGRKSARDDATLTLAEHADLPSAHWLDSIGKDRLGTNTADQQAALAIIQGDKQAVLPQVRADRQHVARLSDDLFDAETLGATPETVAALRDSSSAARAEFANRHGMDAAAFDELDAYYAARDELGLDVERPVAGPVEAPGVARLDAEVDRLMPMLTRQADDRLAGFGERALLPDEFRSLDDDLTVTDLADAQAHAAALRNEVIDIKARIRRAERGLEGDDPDLAADNVMELEARLEQIEPEVLPAQDYAYAVAQKVGRAEEQGVGPMDSKLRRDVLEPGHDRSMLSEDAAVTARDLQREAQRAGIDADLWTGELRSVPEGMTADALRATDEFAAWDGRRRRMIEREQQHNPAFMPPKQRQKYFEVAKIRERLNTEMKGVEGPAAQVLRSELASLPVTLDDLVKATRYDPNHRVQLVGGGRVEPSVGDGRLGTSKVGSERYKAGSDIDRTTAGQVQRIEKRQKAKATNEALRKVTNEYGIVEGQPIPGHPGSIASDEWARTQINRDGERYLSLEAWGRDNGFAKLDMADIGQRFRQFSDDPELQALADEFDQLAVGEASRPTTVLLPEWARAGFEDILPPPPATGVVKGLDRIVGAWKTSVLPLMPRWHMANVVGNGLAVTVGNDVPLSVMLASRGEVRRALRNPANRVEARLRDNSTAAEVVRGTKKERLLNDPTLPKPPEAAWSQAVNRVPGVEGYRRNFNKVTDASYKANATVDNAAHLWVYASKKLQRERTLAELDADVKAGRVTKRDADQLRSKEMTDEQIMDEALAIAGDFKSMPRYQHQVLRRIFPFVAWYKHITKFVMKRMPFDSPYRSAWMFKVADMYDDPENRPGWMQSSLQFGNGMSVNLGAYSPFAGGSMFASPLLDPQSATSALSPVIQAPLNLGGYNTQQGRLTTFAPGHGPRDESGRPTAGWIGPGASAWWALGQTPQTRLVRDAMAGGVARYDSGQAILRQGRPIDSSKVGGRWAGVPSMLGVPLDRPDVENALRIEEQRRRSDAQARRQYDRRLTRTGLRY